jgi:hypothetical protein
MSLREKLWLTIALFLFGAVHVYGASLLAHGLAQAETASVLGQLGE